MNRNSFRHRDQRQLATECPFGKDKSQQFPGEYSYSGMQVIDKFKLTADDIDRIVGMAWEDRTPFNAITSQFGLSEAEVVKLMKYQMTLNNWKKWRAQVQGRKPKHLKLAPEGMSRFKSAAQKSITKNRISRKKY